ncbi:hypothetical protein EJ066_21775 [Mesorhizobium sp. M9A.F.Ca.ET.002.03.1.2]|nr:hypothetical protein EJ066_21775 [Mesorhizobium sp. M9A.F.Ca.ET.002.03.1.2]
MISASSATRSRPSPARRSSQGISPGSTSSPILTNTVSLHLLPRVDHKNGARRTSSRGGRCFPRAKQISSRGEFRPQGFRPSSSGERNFVKADLLPGDDEYGRSSPPPEDRPAKRHPPDLLPRRVLLFWGRAFPDSGLSLCAPIAIAATSDYSGAHEQKSRSRHRRRPRRFRSGMAGGRSRRSSRAA